MNKRFMLTAAGAAATGIASSATAELVNFTHDLDRWAGESSWQVYDADSNIVASQYVSGNLWYAGATITASTYYTSSTAHWGTIHGTLDLASGDYNVQMQDSANDGWAWGSFVGGLAIGSGSATFAAGGVASFDFSVSAVPAPGALALLGLAGVAGTRRRK